MFGICKGSNPPSSETVILVKDTKLNKGATGNEKGKKCIPIILGDWIQTKEDNAIAGKGSSTVTSKSFLVCQYGGFIEFYSTGLEYKGVADQGR